MLFKNLKCAMYINLYIKFNLINNNQELSPSGKDGPTTALVNVLKELGGVAPTDWPGYRELIEH